MRQVCKFNSKCDIRETVPGLDMNLEQAISTGVVTDTASAEQYNNMESPDEVGGLVRDNFDAMDAGNGLAQLVNNENVLTPSGEDE